MRRSIYEFFCSLPEKNGLIEALKWLVFEEYIGKDDAVWHLATCPHCGEGVDIRKKELSNDYTIPCPHCGGTIYLTDIP